MHTVMAFDIGSDARRARIVKMLLLRAQRVQESVFEGHLDDMAFLRLRSELEGSTNPPRTACATGASAGPALPLGHRLEAGRRDRLLHLCEPTTGS